MSKTLKAAVKAEMIPRRVNIRILLCMFAAMPVSFILSGANMLDFEGFDISSAAFAILIFFIALLFEVYLCVSLFKDCHSGENADVALSLPVSAEERFVAKGIIYTLCVTLPFLAVSVIMLITAFLVCIYYDWGTNDIFMPWLSMMFEGLVMMICVMGVSFLCSSLCSSAAGALATSILGILALTLLPLELYSATLSCAHIDTQEHLPYLLGCFGFDGMELLITEGADRPGYYISGLVNILISVLLIITALKVYTRRDRRTITENRYSKPFMLAILAITAFIGAEMTIIHAGILASVTMLIAGLAVYLLVLTKKGFGFKKSRKWLISFAALCIGFLILNTVMIDTCGFHMSRLPQGANESEAYTFEAWTEKKFDKAGGSVKYYHNENLSVSQLEKAHELLQSYEDKAASKQKASEYILNGLNTIPGQGGGIKVYATTILTQTSYGARRQCVYYIINESDYDELIRELYSIT